MPLNTLRNDFHSLGSTLDSGPLRSPLNSPSSWPTHLTSVILRTIKKKKKKLKHCQSLNSEWNEDEIPTLVCIYVFFLLVHNVNVIKWEKNGRALFAAACHNHH